MSITLVSLRFKPCDKFLSALATEHRGEIFINGGFYMKKDLAKAIVLGLLTASVCSVARADDLTAKDMSKWATCKCGRSTGFW